MPNLENQRVLHFDFHSQKLLRLYHNTYILLFGIYLSTKPSRGWWFNRTHLPLFQNMSVKIYTNFFFSSGGYNFKINSLNEKMRHRMWVHILLKNLALSHRNTSITFSITLKCFEKAVKLYPEIFAFKVFVRSLASTIFRVGKVKTVFR